MPEDTGFNMDDACIPHAWYPSEARRNTQFVMTYDVVVHFVAIDSGRYPVKDLVVAVVDAVNTKVTTFKTLPSEHNI